MESAPVFSFPPEKAPTRFRRRALVLVVFCVVVGALLLHFEFRSSFIQSRVFSSPAGAMTYELEPGEAIDVVYPDSGPQDIRFGYALLPSYLGRLTDKGFVIDSQARMSPAMRVAGELGLFVPYREKSRGGITLLDRNGDTISLSRFPVQAYDSFDSIPQAIVETILFIEDRELLDAHSPRKNPAVEWGRMGRAVLEMAGRKITGDDRNVPGASTLATQIEKFRHSRFGITDGVIDKLRQMVSASLRAYQEGPVTVGARRRILLDYINSVPMAARPGVGEIHGLGDALNAWFAADVDALNRRLAAVDLRSPTPPDTATALAYKQVLSLFLAHRRPTDYLHAGRTALMDLTDAYLRVLTSAGRISPAFRDAALAAKLEFRTSAEAPTRAHFIELKAANALRIRLLELLGLPRLYDLDRLDLTVEATLERDVQREVTRVLLALKDPVSARAPAVRELKTLHRGDPAGIIYSFTLYERGEGMNLLRVETDNFDQPFNINRGVKLDLGSTAKLRTLITYLDIMDQLHREFAPLSRHELLLSRVASRDRLSHWAREYLLSAADTSLTSFLRAAMERKYSGSPAEIFFTGGGAHTFRNFSSEDNGRILTVTEALHRSTNLVFIRLMRDISRYYMFRVPGSTAGLFGDDADTARFRYLALFADREGQVFLNRFYRKYAGREAAEFPSLLLQESRLSSRQAALVYRMLYPRADSAAFRSFVESNLPGLVGAGRNLDHDFAESALDRISLVDRAYLARIHPLELWTAAYLTAHPGSSRGDLIAASAGERQEVYQWLFRTRRRDAQDIRIRTLLEVEAFLEIHKQWRRMGYAFESLVSSYATSIGSSADRPEALAEMMGILVNDGIRYPSCSIRSLHFATATPYEARLSSIGSGGERVLSAEVAAIAREAVFGVVEKGTARRLRGVFRLPNGEDVPVGGKTGTGDHRFETIGPGGRVIASRVVNRTATFVFMIGDRFYGTLVAYVPGAAAEDYRFTSSLPVQLLKVLAPTLNPLLVKAYAVPEPVRGRHRERPDVGTGTDTGAETGTDAVTTDTLPVEGQSGDIVIDSPPASPSLPARETGPVPAIE